MSYAEFLTRMNLRNNVFAITRIQQDMHDTEKKAGCIFSAFEKVQKGETVVFTQSSVGCNGGATGLGFSDGLPPIPGGFGYFLSYGRGEGYRQGERLKCDPETAERMMFVQPKNVMEGKNAIRVEQYQEGIETDTVTILANPDQLSALIFLFNYQKADYDTVIAPATSGCSQIFRIPFGELYRDQPRAVIGNTDVFSRPHLEANLLSFTISANDFQTMCDATESCFFHSHIWPTIEKRLAACPK